MTHMPPPYRCDYAPSFVEALDLPDPDRAYRLVELLEAMRRDDLNAERCARAVWSEVLEAYATEGSHMGFIRCVCQMMLWEPLKLYRARFDTWLWRGRVLRDAMGRAQGNRVWLRHTLGRPPI